MMKFLVKQQKIEVLEREVLASDQIAFVSVKFVFDGTWKTLHKVVQFTQCEETYNVVLGIDGTTCLLPAELHPGSVKMSLFGYDAESDTTLRATTVPVTLHIRPSGFVEDGATPIPPTPDLYTQLLKKLSEMQTGANGKDGRSAYEIAIENGFVGTAAEWLESLKGMNGVDGKDGVSPDLTNYPDTDVVKALIQAAVQSLLEKAHTHENHSALEQISAAKIAQWDGFGTQINGLSTKITVYSEKTERTLESLQKQIDNLTSGRNYTILFQSGQDAISTYASNLSMILDGGYQTMKDFLAAYPQFCSAENDFVLSYLQECFNWDKSVLTVCAKPLSLTKNAEIVMSYQSGSSEAGSLYLVPKPQKIDIPVGVYVNTEIDANRAVSLDFQWLQSDNFITTITECTGISDGEYYLAWIAGMSLQSAARTAGHPMAHSTVRRMLQRKCYLGDAFYPAILDKETYARANAEWQHRADVMQRLGKTRRKPVCPQTKFLLELPQQIPELDRNTPFQQAEYLYHLIQNKE